jgi:hypothetical protein
MGAGHAFGATVYGLASWQAGTMKRVILAFDPDVYINLGIGGTLLLRCLIRGIQ